jgi:hypothetical protein
MFHNSVIAASSLGRIRGKFLGENLLRAFDRPCIVSTLPDFPAALQPKFA